MNIKLPKNFLLDDNGHLFFKNECVSHGFATVVRHTLIKKQSGKEVTSVELKFHINGAEYSQEYSVEQLEKTKFYEVPALYLEHPRTVNMELFKQSIRYQIALTTPIIKYEVEQLGYSVIAGKRVYCFGNKILGATDLNICISENLKGFKLQYNPVNKHTLASGLNKFLSLNPSVSLAMMSYLVLGLSRQVFMDADVPIHFVLFIVGQNQSFKTTLSCLYFNLFNRHDDLETHLQNFSSTKSKLVHVLDQVKDAPLVFDDMNKSDSASIMRRQEEAVSSLIQMAANNVGKQTMRNSYKIAGQLIFCGEYMLKNESTVNRTILLQFSSDLFDKRKIKELQGCADTIPQFAEEYVCWLLENYDAVKQKIKEHFDYFKDKLGEDDTSQKRLVTSVNVLKISFEIFMDFCEYQGWQSLLSYKEIFAVHLTNLMCKQVEAYQLACEEEIDICCELFFAVHDHYMNDLPEDEPKKKFVPPVYYDYTHELLYIRGEAAAELFHKRTGKIIRYPVIFKEFDKLNFLVFDKTKDNLRTKTPPKSKNRYYCIRYLDWKAYVKEMVENEGCY